MNKPDRDSWEGRRHTNPPGRMFHGPINKNLMLKDFTYEDIFERLYKDRIIFILKDLEDDLPGRIIAILQSLSAENDSDISIYIDSRRGDSLAGIAIYETMQNVKPDIATYVVGTAGPAASLIVVGGKKRKRYALAGSKIRIQQPYDSYFNESLEVLLDQTADILKLRKTITDIYEKNTKLTLPMIDIMEEYIEIDSYMCPREAQAWGIVDYISGEDPLSTWYPTII